MKNFFAFGFAAFLILFLALPQAQAQKIFTVKSKFDATTKVHVVKSKFDADLLVYRVNSKFDATKEGLWFEVNSKFDADVLVFFTDSKFDADIKIFYVNSKFDAGWRNESKKSALKRQRSCSSR
jgi:hypothetical protein